MVYCLCHLGNSVPALLAAVDVVIVSLAHFGDSLASCHYLFADLSAHLSFRLLASLLQAFCFFCYPHCSGRLVFWTLFYIPQPPLRSSYLC